MRLVKPALLVLATLILAGVAWRILLPDTPASSVAPARPPAPARSPSTESNPPVVPPAPVATTSPSIADLLRAPATDHAATARQLGALVLDSQRSHEERAEALSHILNLSAGHEETVLLPLVRDPSLLAAHCRTILEDALNQPPSWQAEVYLTALRTRPEPALRKYIREHLAFITDGPDLGDDPAAWREPVVQALAQRLR